MERNQLGLMRAVAIDTETNGKDVRFDPDFRMLGLSYANTDGQAEYLSFGHIADNTATHEMALSVLRREVERNDYIVFHNAKHDITVILRTFGLSLWEVNWFDTMLMQHMLDENLPSKALDYLGKHHFNEGKEKDEEFTRFLKAFGWAFVPAYMMEPYAVQDAKLTLKLFLHLYPEFCAHGYC